MSKPKTKVFYGAITGIRYEYTSIWELVGVILILIIMIGLCFKMMAVVG